jgi:hypothetical protein
VEHTEKGNEWVHKLVEAGPSIALRPTTEEPACKGASRLTTWSRFSEQLNTTHCMPSALLRSLTDSVLPVPAAHNVASPCKMNSPMAGDAVLHGVFRRSSASYLPHMQSFAVYTQWCCMIMIMHMLACLAWGTAAGFKS